MESVAMATSTRPEATDKAEPVIEDGGRLQLVAMLGGPFLAP
jgi:hypothetical protein